MSLTYLAVEDAFAAGECDALIALGRGAQGESAAVWAQGAYGLDAAARRVRTTLHVRSGETQTWFARLDALLARGAEAFGVAVGPISEPVQILSYGPGDHFARWHSDAGMDQGERRLVSLSIELSEPGDHEGGLLEVVPDTVMRPRTLGRGGAHVFPSRALHRVTPVTRGERWSLVAWTGAPRG